MPRDGRREEMVTIVSGSKFGLHNSAEWLAINGLFMCQSESSRRNTNPQYIFPNISLAVSCPTVCLSYFLEIKPCHSIYAAAFCSNSCKVMGSVPELKAISFSMKSLYLMEFSELYGSGYPPPQYFGASLGDPFILRSEGYYFSFPFGF